MWLHSVRRKVVLMRLWFSRRARKATKDTRSAREQLDVARGRPHRQATGVPLDESKSDWQRQQEFINRAGDPSDG